MKLTSPVKFLLLSVERREEKNSMKLNEILSLLSFLIFAFALGQQRPNFHKLNSTTLTSWIEKGRFHNHDGWVVFYRDSLGDSLQVNKESVEKVVNLPVLVLLHGYPTFSLDFTHLYGPLKLTHHVVVLDFLGFGLSDKPQKFPYTLMYQSDIVESLVKDIKHQRCRFSAKTSFSKCTQANLKVSIIAHDYGVSVAQELLARHNDRRRTNGTATPSPSVRSPTEYTIQSVVLLNGGLFAETHRPTFMQHVLLNKHTGPLVSLFTTFKLFSKSLSVVFGPDTRPTEEEMRIFWEVLRHKGGDSVLHNLQQ